MSRRAVGDVRHVDAQVGGAVAVDLHPQLGAVELERGVGVDDAAELLGPHAQLLGVGGERLEVGAAEGEVDVEVAAADVEGRHVAHRAAQVRELGEARADRRHHVALAVVAAEGGRRDRGGRGRARKRVSENLRSSCGAMRTKTFPWLTPPRKPPPAVASTLRTPCTWRSSRLDRAHRLVHGGEARPLGPRDVDLELRLVDVARDVLQLDQLEQRDRGEHDAEAEQRRRAPVGHGEAQQPLVAAVEPGVEALPRARRAVAAPWPPWPAAASSARSRRALIIGVSVKETSSETSTATAAVRPNW